MKRAIVFPGQGSQVVGMGRDLAEAIPECKALFDQANEILGYDLAAICFEGPQEELNKSNHAQLGIFVASAAAFKALELKQPGLEFDVLAGHSLGEWTALYVSGAISFEDTIKVLKARGEFMQAACEENPGAMLAVMNLDGDKLVEIAAEAGCHVANFNSLSQTVLSGTVESIEKAEGLCKDAGAKRAVRLPVAGAFHSPLMQPAADKMNEFLSGVELGIPAKPVLSNVTAEVHVSADIQENMVKQITSSVQWVASVQKLIADGVKEIVEVGPGKVLAGLIKRIDKGAAVRNIGALTNFE
ncbi:ACP S-malonyltransferase [Pontiella agarivorans]|uniref:Malonyl CoA-acyl carrier protein transacylase n=1 Tax=Pontiella agarivorans TaxID=3038953 RepID=A0ABU5N0Y4_9BACT|nr:ACP S-malonyltransferase [Pontiella agarivorans]MDZ8120105.1 ACP S-malonyltransferase [Pontiella agarivorans]